MHEAVHRPRTISGAVTPPGDRSISVRAVILNAIAEGEARIANYGPGGDCASALAVLRGLGVPIEPSGDGFVVAGGALREPSDVLDAGNSGTVMRLASGLLASQPFLGILTGDASLRSRPMDRVIVPLRAMGADVRGRGGDRLAPLAVRGGELRGIRYRMPVASAQVKSAILIAALAAEGETVIEQPAMSRDHTERALSAMGAAIHEDGLTLILRPSRLRAVDVTVPGDLSSAAFWLVAGVCHPDAEVRLLGVGINPGRTGVLDALSAMGADVSLENQRVVSGEPIADLVARSSRLRAAELSGDLIPRVQDELPILALAACFADGETIIADAQELRVKETDRIHTTVAELRRLGADAHETPDGMRIVGGAALRGAQGDSRGDHRIAMMLGVAGLLAAGEMEVQGAEAASVTYPAFWDDLRTLAGNDERGSAPASASQQ